MIIESIHKQEGKTVISVYAPSNRVLNTKRKTDRIKKKNKPTRNISTQLQKVMYILIPLYEICRMRKFI